MSTVEQYISTLLYLHECVVIPNFGGFITVYKPANIDPIKHTFYPPSKQIYFNKNLTQNDGLLTHHIVSTTGSSYDEANILINDFIKTIRTTLDKNNQIEFPQFGSFFYDNEKRMQFESKNSVNYLRNAYGLPTFHQFPLNTNNLDTQEPEIIENTSRKKWMVAAIAVPLLLLTAWVPYKYNLNDTLSTNYASLNVFSSAEIPNPTYSVRTQNIQVAQNTETVKIQHLLKPVKQETIAKETPVLTTERKQEVQTKASSTQHHIVAGCFGSLANAKKLVKKLQNKGYAATLAGKRKNLHVVSYGGYTSKNSAKKALIEAKKDNKSAWILFM